MSVYKKEEILPALDKIIKEKKIITLENAYILLRIDRDVSSMADIRETAAKLGHGVIEFQQLRKHLEKRGNEKLKREIKGQLKDVSKKTRYVLVEKNYSKVIMKRLRT